MLAPNPTPEEQQALEAFWNAYKGHAATVEAQLTEALKDVAPWDQFLASQTDEQRRAQSASNMRLQEGALLHGAWDPYLADTRRQGVMYAQMGISFPAWVGILRLYRKRFFEFLVAERTSEGDLMTQIRGMDHFIDIATTAIGEAYLDTKQEIITAQQEAIREISTPVLPVRSGLLLLPLVGVMDSRRARDTTEMLLHAIRTHRARVVVMDVSGVPIVDTKVASHFLQSVQAARLMGAVAILTGISPEIAQTMVTLGATLGDTITLGDLQAGLVEADRLLAAEPA